MHSVLVESNIRYIAFGNIALTSVHGKHSSKTPSTKANTGPSIIADIPIDVHALFKIRVYYKFRKWYCGFKITSYDHTLTTMGFSVSARLFILNLDQAYPSIASCWMNLAQQAQPDNGESVDRKMSDYLAVEYSNTSNNTISRFWRDTFVNATIYVFGLIVVTWPTCKHWRHLPRYVQLSFGNSVQLDSQCQLQVSPGVTQQLESSWKWILNL